ncbi:MAG: tRNA (guanine37-N1)-methyltransferase [Myxococcota bacterium]|jgi:tRNA (guanine37-N1)-methyltransferase
MRFDVLTLFPDMVQQGLAHSITARAQEQGVLDVGLHDIRQWSTNKHRNVDDSPYGGGPGMIMSVDATVAALESIQAERPVARRLLFSPAGRRFDQSMARELADLHTDGSSVALVCGRYEGIDQRVADHFIDEEISVGDFILSGGELAAMIVIDAVTRLLPGALGNSESPEQESLQGNVLEFPQYTRPRDFRGHVVPDVLLSGDHARIARWRRRQSLLRTRERRPDLWLGVNLSPTDKKLLES